MREADWLQKKVTLRAMHLLECMDYTERGLREKLQRSEYPPEMIANAIEYVRSYGYIDDVRYACNYIRYRMDTKSKRQLFQLLQQKGVSKDDMARGWALATEEGEPDERGILRALIEKKCEDDQVLSLKEYRRLQGFLARKGFGWEDVSAVLREKNITFTRE